ncbi:hypothetical protein Trydic_g10094 [Trypoxylus dichotomus]
MSSRNPTTLMSISSEESKTCVVQRFKNGTFLERHGNTIGVDFSMKTVMVDGKKVKLQIWDTAGQERFRTITQSKWVEEVRRYSGSSILVALVGNKADLDTLREVEFEEAEAMCQYMPEVLFVLEASAKENSNIEEAFLCLATELKRRHDSGYLSSDDEETVKLGDSSAVTKCSACTRGNLF